MKFCRIIDIDIQLYSCIYVSVERYIVILNIHIGCNVRNTQSVFYFTETPTYSLNISYISFSNQSTIDDWQYFWLIISSQMFFYTTQSLLLTRIVWTIPTIVYSIHNPCLYFLCHKKGMCAVHVWWSSQLWQTRLSEVASIIMNIHIRRYIYIRRDMIT